ncbi:MAG: tRNA (adenosine(37)-N6)-threonylcarbamoyltransferase complex ATPase subunit type 1 TsaE [Actinomycetia bacterium]|nr:tRNA (adenosine(37)-N6)-threonylcarbamoyltransferase complex ATPase subunit type 1 TsaE [Actinomycetes bacterium]
MSTVTSPPLVDAHETRAWGARLGRLLRAGDLVILTGDLGAGKTTLTQGIAEGLGVRGPITSPTFVIARVHPSLAEGPVLVHVDAYRLAGWSELDDLDLDADLDRAVTVVEWGRGLAEELSGAALDITLAGESVRTATVLARGERWAGDRALAELAQLAAPAESVADIADAGQTGDAGQTADAAAGRESRP